MFVQSISHSAACNGVRDYLDNVAAAARTLLHAVSGHKPRVPQTPAAAQESMIQPRKIAKASHLPDEIRLYRLMSGSESVSPAVAAELEAIVSRNRLN